MNKLFAPFLPPWVETGLQPAFYDMESGTVLQQTARMYAKVQQLTRLFNELSEETKTTVDEYIAKFVELKDFVDDYFDNLDVQEEINNKLDVMAEDGTLADIISGVINSTLKIYAPKLLLSGNLTLIEFSENGITKRAIIDFGHYSATYYTDMAYKLVSAGYTKFDYAFITHYHQDHVGSCVAMLQDSRFDFSDCTFYLPQDIDYNEYVGDYTDIQTYETDIKAELASQNIPYVQPTNSTEIDVNSTTKINFFNCDTSVYSNYYNVLSGGETDLNNFSMIVQITHNNSRMLFGADLEGAGQKEVLAQGIEVPDFILVPHHGQGVYRAYDSYDGGWYQPFVEKIYRPEVAIIEGLAGTTDPAYPVQSLSRLYKTYWSSDGDINITHAKNYKVDGVLYSPDVDLGHFLTTNFIKGGLNLRLEDVPSRLATGDNLDTYITGGTYYSINIATTGTITNKPADVTAQFKLVVNQIDSERAVQTLYEQNSPFIYVRFGRHVEGGANSWKPWQTITADGIGKLLTNNTDMDTITMVGDYHIDSGANAQTLIHFPTEINVSCKITVKRLISADRLQQMIIVNSSTPDIYVRTKASGGWSNWYKLTSSSVAQRDPA